jgi:hypothetical protein
MAASRKYCQKRKKGKCTMSNKLITPEFRGSFVNLVEPRAIAEGQDPVYGMVVAVPKSETAFKQKLDDVVNELCMEKWGEVPKKLKNPIRDGDEEDRPEFEGCWVFNTKSKTRPGVVDMDLQPILDPDLLYSGAWYRVELSAFAWDHRTGGKGVSFGLNNVLFVREDEAYSGRANPAEAFKAVV